MQYVRYGSINELYCVSKVNCCKTFLALANYSQTFSNFISNILDMMAPWKTCINVNNKEFGNIYHIDDLTFNYDVMCSNQFCFRFKKKHIMRLFNVKRWFINIYHPRIFWISMFIVLINVRVLPGKNMFESSANGILNNREDTRDKSFIYSKNKMVPIWNRVILRSVCTAIQMVRSWHTETGWIDNF